ncbi:beta-propeller fold lactonase family protein [Amnibacterium sp. CER49]|uniref:lactonase family protein n=1 Tax=Amnibacterium sp. CER49 TaxID=3039161 RepID=UPI00244B7E89|nr:beta-propeller fold lactonase family protein [Amnibacterium sp. CER49]MDH2444070.1 beta-propeller fold lactonase family protein [Amnibacterium sp. CER49]
MTTQPQQHAPERDDAVLVACAGDESTGGLFRLSLRDGRAQREATIAALACVVRHPFLPLAYTVTGPGTGALQTWAVGDGLRLLSARPTEGTEPCHLAVHPSGTALVVVNYGSGSLLTVALDEHGMPTDPAALTALEGSGPDTDRQDAAHPHQAVFVGDGHVLLVPDLGADLLRAFALDPVDASLTAIGASPLPPGTGPRHLALPAEGVVAVTGELAETLCVGALDTATGAVTAWRTIPSTTRTPTSRNYPGDLVAVPGTATVHVANRGADTLARFDLSGAEPRLLEERDAGVAWPQHLAVAGDALLVAGRESSRVARLPLPSRGAPAAPTALIELPRPVWLAP